MRKAVLVGALVVAVIAVCAGGPAAEAPGKQPGKPTLKLKAKSIIFDRAKGDMVLTGDVHVIRTVDKQVMTVDCDRMTSKMKDGKMETVHATGNVKVKTEEYIGTAVRAEFDFSKNIIKLYGEKGRPASVTSTSPEMTSTGPEIIFYLNDQRVELKDGETFVPLKERGQK